jgi:hypothetical protein
LGFDFAILFHAAPIASRAAEPATDSLQVPMIGVGVH